MKEPLYWYCQHCDAREVVVEPGCDDPGYELGDSELCITCLDGVARVVTLAQAARQSSRATMRREEA